jgi:signal transduction histidine kinase
MEVILTVEDDGAGLPARRSAGLGLDNLAERARTLHGSFTLESAAPHGVRGVWSVPRDAQPKG